MLRLQLLAGCIAIPHAAVAQEPSVPTVYAAASTEDGTITDIVVTAQRRSQVISQVPISVQALSAKELERTGPLDTTTLLSRLSPSVSFRVGTSMNSTSVSIRGVSSLAVEGGIQPSTSVVVDGVPLYRQGEFISDLNDVESIEVLRGPQGTLFGKNSTAGVISITTRRPGKELGGRIQAGATTDEEYFVNGAIDLPLNDSIRTRFTGFYRDQNPLVKNMGPAGDALGNRSYGFTGRIEADITPDLNLLVSGGYFSSYSTYPIPFLITPVSQFNRPGGNLQVIATGLTGGYGNDRLNTNETSIATGKTRYIQSQLDWAASDRVSMTAITSYRTFNTEQITDSDLTPYGYEFGTGFRPNLIGYPFTTGGNKPGTHGSPERIEYGSQEIRMNYSGDRANIVTGLFYQTVSINQSAEILQFFDGSIVGRTPGQFYVNEARYRALIDNDSAAVFGDVTYRLSDQFTVFAGARFTHETISEDYGRDNYSFLPVAALDPNTFDFLVPPVSRFAFVASESLNKISGRAGIQWFPAEGQNYYASYNRGYKGPAVVTGRAANVTPTAPAIVKPEIADAFEIGTKQRLFANTLSLGLSLYKQKIKNIQQTGNIPGTTSQALQSVGDLKSKGAEFEAQWRITPEFSLSGGVAYTDARYSGGNAVVSCPAIFVCTGNGSNIPAGFQSIDGRRAINAPKWAYNIAAGYSRSIGNLGKIALNADYSWKGQQQFNVNQDPRTIEPSHGFLNASLTLTGHDGWEVQIYGRNLTNEFYYASVSSAYPVADKFGLLARDYKRYGGISFKYTF